MKKACVICGREFSASNDRAKTCGKPACSKAFKDLRALAARETIICPVCGKEFTALKSSKQICCSAACAHERQRGKQGDKWFLTTCECCGKEFKTMRSHPKKFCSATCRNIGWVEATRKRNAEEKRRVEDAMEAIKKPEMEAESLEPFTIQIGRNLWTQADPYLGF